MADDLDIRLLRYYVAVADELHFTRAAQRLFVAQQVLSREIQRLEQRVGVRLLDRTTRRVVLTPAGHTLLARARELLALHDTTLREVRGERRSLTVDIVGPGLTPALVLALARERASDVEFFARFHTGADAAVPHVLAGRLDVTFGRHPGAPDGLRQRVIRHEPISVLLPQGHPLVALDAVPFESLRGTAPCMRAGDHVTQGWEHAVLQLLAPFGVDLAGAHPHVQGADELAEHLRQRDAPILTMTTQPAVPGGVLRPLVDPVALYPWTLIWRADLDHPGLTALQDAAAELATTQGWLTTPDNAWLPRPEAATG
ncbi:LysR family transcriptional regulator [Kibdelosporangium phytohabitans]|uniref:LysR family transcriptional regulator n=1 Tax=Kibdelosporangium phytohabitans TaxID=860235 RepID=A0A0N9I3F1_9PSEU|nr:LysR family transcriptional regulator [Kibdelosporangium phytohabitans]ALG10426.1 LysR family transcriptional regulator [Kibdelosporangium phytohabitans]MBE1461494.1 DNA-binding transcriptional LysR family regulator [Kibdelosporangium phytohabitans]